MMAGSEQVEALSPGAIKYWEYLRQKGAPLYPEKITEIIVEDDLPGGYSARDKKVDEVSVGESKINQIAELLGVAVEEWPSQVISFIGRSGQFNSKDDRTQEVRSLRGKTLGEFIMDTAYDSVPIEGNIDGFTNGMSLTLQAAGKYTVTFSSDNDLWYAEYETQTDQDGYEYETEKEIASGGFSYTVRVALDALVAGEVVEGDLGVGEAEGEQVGA
jgi:hypothetical protein